MKPLKREVEMMGKLLPEWKTVGDVELRGGIFCLDVPLI